MHMSLNIMTSQKGSNKRDLVCFSLVQFCTLSTSYALLLTLTQVLTDFYRVDFLDKTVQ